MRVATEVPAFVLVTLCAACSSAPSPTSPTPSRDASRLIPVADYSGAWHGVYTITECTGQRHCFQVRGRQMPFVLRLSQAGHAVEGVLHVDGFSVPVTGMAAPAGDLNVTGHLASPGPRSAAVDVTRFAARRHDQGFEAELVFTKTYPPTATESQTVYGPVQHTGGRIESASRGALTPLESFEGVWFGRAVIRECLVVSGPTCSLGPSEERDFKLSLQQNGTHVSGSLTFPQLGEVTGTVTGNTLELERAAIETPGGSQRSVLHLERWTGRRDAAGLLTGSFEYVEEMLWLLTPPRENYVTRYLADVVSGVLLP